MSRKHNIFPIFIFFSALSILILLLGSFGFFPTSVFTRSMQPIQTFIFTLFHNDNNQHDDQLLLLQKRLVEQKKLLREIQALRDQFQSTSLSHEILLPATIIGSPGFIANVSLPHLLIVNVGAKQGVKKGQIVVYKDNIIGIISAVNDTISRVSLLGNTSFTLSAMCLETKTIGLIKGLGDGEILLDNVLLADTLQKNDLVASKGDIAEDGRGFPPNLIVGKIISIEKNPSSLFQKAKVKSLVNVENLSIVFIKIQK